MEKDYFIFYQMVRTRVTASQDLVQTRVTNPILLNSTYYEPDFNQQYLTLYIQKISRF
jgi:hypothetical protein